MVRFSSAISRVGLIVASAGLVVTAAAEPTERSTKSVSCGSVNRGGLGNPVELERRGVGYQIPRLWWKRGNRYGTAELVGMIRRAAALVERVRPGGVLGVADLSRARGGAIPHHRSHQSGRDVDLIYYATDLKGRPLPPGNFLPRYRADKRATHTSSPTWKKLPGVRRFDGQRNWLLVAAMASDPIANVDRIFVSLRVYRWLMDAAKKAGASREVIETVAGVLRVAPHGKRDHGDHFHVRIKCTAEDIRLGLCRPYLAPRKRDGTKWRWGIRCPR